MNRSRVTIPHEHYIGVIKRGYDNIPYAFITENGTDKKSCGRITTIDSILKRYSARSTKVLANSVLQNIPMSGFKLVGTHQSGGYRCYDRFRIRDPRGFETDVTSGNIDYLLSNALIKNGEILDECRWARNVNTNVLLITSTDEYKTAISNTTAARQKLRWSNAKIGNTVRLRNNVVGVYLGRMNVMVKGYNRERYTTTGTDEIVTHSNPFHVIHVNESGYPSYTNFLYLVSAPKLSEVIDSTTQFTKGEAEVLANSCLSDEKCGVDCGPFGTVLALSFGKIEKKKLKKVHQSVPDVSTLRKLFESKDNILFVKRGRSLFGRLSYFGSHKCSIYKEGLIKNGELRRVLAFEEFEGNNVRPIAFEKSVDYQFDPADEFFYLEINTTTQQGTKIRKII